MQVSAKLLFRTAIVMLGVLLALSVFVAISSSQKASALDSTQWETVRGYVDDYFAGQYDSARGGEAGLIKGKLDLANNLNNDGDDDTVLASYLDEGDDMANRPVLLDNLTAQTNIIPGTEFRCNWNADQSCFADTSVDAVRELVDAHKAAGFSTDIVDYCVSSHTASPVTGGWGIIAQTGGLSSDGDVPNVRELEFSRNGWINNVPAPVVSSGAVAAPETSAGFSLPATPTAPANCESETDDVGVVACQANWAIASTLGNVGNGQSSMATVGAAQTVDVRPGSISTVSGTAANVQVPMDTLFSAAGLSNIDPLASTFVVTHTQHGGQTAIGLKMLGYTMGVGGYINLGIPRWNSGQGEQQVAIGNVLPRITVAAGATTGKVDTTGPSVTSIAAENVGENSADIHRVAGEPSTLKVEYGTVSGVYTDTENNTVLNADKTVSLTGLDAGTTYYYQATTYDSNANGTVSTGSFTTEAPACTSVKPSLSLSTLYAYWASYADYTAGELSVKLQVSNTGADTAFAVAVTGASNNNGVTLSTATPISLGDIAAGSNVVTDVKYNVPAGVNQFSSNVTGSANDACGTAWTYGS